MLGRDATLYQHSPIAQLVERHTDNVEVGSSNLPGTTSQLISQTGGLAQLARAPALHAGGQRFESVILHYCENLRIGD